MGNYYCLMAGLPDIALEKTKAPVTVGSLKEELADVLSDMDQKLMFYFFLEKDCRNLTRLLKNPEAEIDPLGNMSMEQYRDLITSAREMNFNVHRYPSFMSEFAREFEFNSAKPGYFAEDDILYRFYDYAVKCPNKMIRAWYSLNLDITNILTAFLARKNGWDISKFIQGDNEVTEMILNNNTKDFDLSTEFDYVKELMQIVECDDPVMKEKRIDAFKWQWLEEQTFFNPFSIEAVFAYACKLSMLERWDSLDVEKGQETFRQIIDDLRGEARVPDEFVAKSAFVNNSTEEGTYNKSEK